MSTQELPVIPLRGATVFPYTITTLDVGRKSSMIAIEQAVSEDSSICLAQQKDPTIEYPLPSDLYQVGVLAEIRQVIKIPGGYARVLVEGIERVEIKSFIAFEPYIKAEIEEIPIISDEEDDISALVRAVNEAFIKYMTLSHHLVMDSFSALTDIDDPEQLADLIGGNLPLAYDKKQVLLEAKVLRERLEKLLAYLHEEIAVLQLEQKIQKQVQEKMEETQREYYLREQLRTIQLELGQNEIADPEVIKYQDKFDILELSEEAEEKIAQEIDRLMKIPQGSPERVVIENYLDWCMSLPWNVLDREEVDLPEAQGILSEDHYGLEKVKERILEYIAVLKMTDRLKGPILCLVGPPGVGKTSLARSIARALGRQFISSSLGGVRDEAEIRGHRRTYIGAMPGRIIQALKRVKTRNPLFLFDEIDKMSSDFRGDPASAMLEVLDPEQNYQFIDHYLDLPFDLSKIVFLTTANSTDNIPRPLLDRMEIIHLSGYTEEEKVQIAIRHLIPKQLSAHGLSKGQLVITEKALQTIVNDYTREAGVRNLERSIAAICRKVVREIVSGDRQRARITERTVMKYLGKPLYRNELLADGNHAGIATALAWTEVGGETMPVEVVIAQGEGKLSLTGKLGEVMQESAQTALSYLRATAEQYSLPAEAFIKKDIHIHVPQGSIPKDGPSAGITIAVALLSAISNKPVVKRVGFTGEITLSGKVLPIGGLKEKLLAAKRAGIKIVVVPEGNKNDIAELPKTLDKTLKIITAEHIKQVFKVAFGGEFYEN